jgi:transcriptional regulator with XRE-family HTH domain
MELYPGIIKKLRANKGWKQKDLAKKIGVSIPSLSEMERGGGAKPENVKKLAEIFEVDASIIMGVQEGAKPADTVEMAEKRDIHIKDTEGEGAKILDLLTRAVEVLESSSIFRQALTANINAFHQAVRTEEKNQALQVRIDHLESRLAAVEEKLKGG